MVSYQRIIFRVLITPHYQVGNMVNTGITVPEELLEDFDDVVWALEVEGELPRDTSRSAVIQDLMQEFVDEHRELLDDSGKQTSGKTVINGSRPEGN